MCGIAVIVNAETAEFESASALHENIVRMTQAIRHRGPDDEGYAFYSGIDWDVRGGQDTPHNVYTSQLPWTADKSIQHGPLGKATIALGHRRLAIVDTSPAGHQPMSNKGRTHWIVYNGEIYNYRELRSELRQLGHTFATHCDTEVVLAAYAQWGENCLHRFNGMWAFAIVDTTRRLLFASCDRFGIKPLYYWKMPAGGVAIASEIKQFSVLPGWRPRANVSRCYDFLRNGTHNHTGDTFFEDVHCLRGGQSLALSLSGAKHFSLRPKQWYRLPEPSSDQINDLTDAADRFRSLLTDSVRLRLRADVPVGSCLSGGLDSSSIVCLTQQLLRANGHETQQLTVSSCSNTPRFDERPFIAQVVGQTKVTPHYVFPNPSDLFNLLPTLVWHQDQPFGSSSVFAQWNVFAKANEAGLKVMLDGQGADEQLAGYSPFVKVWLAQLSNEKRVLRYLRELLALGRCQNRGPKWMARQALASFAPRTLAAVGQLTRKSRRVSKATEKPDWLRQEPVVASHPTNGNGCQRKVRLQTVNDLCRTQLTNDSLPKLLHYEDRNSMAHSVEARVPFLDYRLVEFLTGLPDSFKIRDGQTKAIMRLAMKGVIPEQIRRRQDKMGFVTPEEDWARQDMPEMFRAHMRQACASAPKLLDETALLGRFQKVLDGGCGFDFRFWRVISFGAWIERFSVSLAN